MPKIAVAGLGYVGLSNAILLARRNEVVAVDVGYGQLVWRLQNDDRVRVLDRTNIRTLTPEMMGGPAELMVGDLSFISLKLVLPALVECMVDGADMLPMVKPQFEVGKDRLGSGGVVRAIPAPATHEKSRKFFDDMNDWARREGFAGLGYVTRKGGEFGGPIAKNLGEPTDALMKALGLGQGDAAFFVAGDPNSF
mgnify:CR=1 FL=1